MREARGDNRLAIPIRKCRAELFQKMNIPVDAVLLGFIETFKLFAKLVRVFHCPHLTVRMA